MEYERLLHFLGDLEHLSSLDDDGEHARGALERLAQIREKVLAMKHEITTRYRTPSSQSSFADTKLTADSIDAPRSGLAPTVAIDDAPTREPDAGIGFIDAIRLAALSIENNAENLNGGVKTATPASTVAPDSTASAAGNETVKPAGKLFAAPFENTLAEGIEDQSSESHPNSISQSEHMSNATSVSNSNGNSIATSNYSDPSESLQHLQQQLQHLQHSQNSQHSQHPPQQQQLQQQLQQQQLQQQQHGTHKVSRRNKYFGKCFPAYRKLFRYETQLKSFLRTKSSTTLYPVLSLDTSHAALVNHSKYQIFSVSSEYNEKPRLKFQGETGFVKARCHVAMNNMWLVIASSDGVLQVVSVQNGKVLFRKNLRLEVTALDVSSDGSYIGIAVVKIIDNGSGLPRTKQPFIYLVCPSTMISPEQAFEHFDIVSFPSPYMDFIRTIAFNDGETALLCSTEKESRVFIVSLADYREPRILLRSRRSNSEIDEDIAVDDNDKHSEGITGAKFLPNSRYILLCSDAPNAPPVVLDTKLTVTKGKSPKGKTVQYLQPSGLQQNVVMRFDKMGSTVQSCTASSRGNGAAFADYSGSVYAVNLPTISTESRKIAVVFNLAPGTDVHSAPALRFSTDGTALIALDRRGDLHIADFGAGHPQQPGIMKTKVLS